MSTLETLRSLVKDEILSRGHKYNDANWKKIVSEVIAADGRDSLTPSMQKIWDIMLGSSKEGNQL